MYNGEALSDPTYHYGSIGIYAAPGSNLSNLLGAALTESVIPYTSNHHFADPHNGDAAVYLITDNSLLVPSWKAQMATDTAGLEPLLPIVAVPENSTYAMFAAGLLGLGFTARRRKQKVSAPSFSNLLN